MQQNACLLSGCDPTEEESSKLTTVAWIALRWMEISRVAAGKKNCCFNPQEKFDSIVTSIVCFEVGLH